MQSDPAATTEYLHQQMPLTKAMGLTITCASDELAIVTAPLGPNLNHQHTAFGGSIATIGITAGWVYLHCRLERENVNARLIIQKSQVEYLNPAASDFEARCISPSAEEWDAFMTMLRKRGRARITRPAQIQCQGKVAAIHHGTYIAIDEDLAKRNGIRG